MGKWWSLLFAAVMAACFGLFLAAPFIPGWWLPEGVSTHSWDIDFLFYVILFVTGFFFVLTETLLVIFMWQFRERTPEEEAELEASKSETPGPVMSLIKKWIPNEQRLELAWTIVPAAILLYIAFAQINTWADIKYQSRMPKLEKELPFPVGVSARQFEWRMRYPSPETWLEWQQWQEEAKEDEDTKKKLNRAFRTFGKTPALSNVHAPNELHVWTTPHEHGETKELAREDYPSFLVHLSTIDVQHNFNIPHFRVKQDALPGKLIPVWFRPKKANVHYNPEKREWDMDQQWDIACAELCGRWHYHMVGKVFVHEDEYDFLVWLVVQKARMEFSGWGEDDEIEALANIEAQAVQKEFQSLVDKGLLDSEALKELRRRPQFRKLLGNG
ncbi:MAG: cytochrome c oxidase subunit II transmembrane domain-containing protein [Gemmataceae bacterium]